MYICTGSNTSSQVILPYMSRGAYIVRLDRIVDCMTGTGIDAVKFPAAPVTPEQSITSHEETVDESVFLHCSGQKV
jgi:hypothetical protein